MAACYTKVLWKNSVSAIFYAVFFKWEPQKPTKTALFAIAGSRIGSLGRVLTAGLWPLRDLCERLASVAVRSLTAKNAGSQSAQEDYPDLT